MRKRGYKGKYKKTIILLFFFSCGMNLLAQTHKDPKAIVADSLFNLSGKNIKKGHFDNAFKNIENSLQLFRSLNDTTAIGNCFSKMGTINYYKGNYPKALLYYNKSIEYFSKTSYKKGISSSNNNKGAIYYYLGNYSKALDYYKKALLLHEELNNKKQIAGTIKNIGGIYLELKDFKNAMVHFQIAKKTFESSLDSKNLSQVLSDIGETYTQQGDFIKAEINFNKALKLAEKLKDKQKIVEVLIGLGKLKNLQKKHKQSLKHYTHSLQISHEINSSLFKSISLISMASLHHKLGNYKQATMSCEKGLKIANQIKVISVQKDAHECLYKINKSLNNNQKALHFFEQMIALEDRLNVKQTSDKILNMKFEKQMLLDSILHIEKERKLEIIHEQEVDKKESQRNIFLITGCFAFIIAGGIFSRLYLVKKSKERLQEEKDLSEHLLLNILPEEIAKELKEKGYVDAQDFEKTSILFTDFKSFTETASKLSPQELVKEINVCFKVFDTIIDTYKIEKIKTIGDAYMAAGGLPKPSSDSVKKTILAGLKMQDFMVNRKLENDKQNKPAFEMRVGIHVGPIVAGIVGVKKFQYDVWGDTVNIASRMESNGITGKVNISEDTYQFIKDEKEFTFEYRGKITAKGKGQLEMYFVSKAEGY